MGNVLKKKMLNKAKWKESECLPSSSKLFFITQRCSRQLYWLNFELMAEVKSISVPLGRADSQHCTDPTGHTQRVIALHTESNCTSVHSLSESISAVIKPQGPIWCTQSWQQLAVNSPCAGAIWKWDCEHLQMHPKAVCKRPCRAVMSAGSRHHKPPLATLQHKEAGLRSTWALFLLSPPAWVYKPFFFFLS